MNNKNDSNNDSSNSSNNEWIFEAYLYRQEVRANWLADQINRVIGDMRADLVTDRQAFAAGLWKLHEHCLELAPLTEDAPSPKPADGTGINPMGIGNEWIAASQNLRYCWARVIEEQPIADEVLEFLGKVAYSAASRSIKEKSSGGGAQK